MVGEKEGGGKDAATPTGCLSTKSDAGFEGRRRGWAGGCWGAEVGAFGRLAGPPPGSHFVAVPAVVPGLGGGAGGAPCPPRPGGAVRGAGRGGGGGRPPCHGGKRITSPATLAH